MTNGIIIGLSSLAGVWFGWYALPLCISIVLLLLVIERYRGWTLLVATLMFSTIGALRSDAPDAVPTSDLLASSTGAVGTIESFPRPAGDGHRVVFRVAELCIGEQCVPASETVVLYTDRQEPPLARGQTIRVEWHVESLAELPIGYRNYVLAQNATASARSREIRVIGSGPKPFQWLAVANLGVSDHLSALLPGDTGALATGIVTGDDSDLSDEATANFRATGTAHITAVSGQNVTIILGFLSLWWHPKTILKRRFLYIGLIIVIWSYALFVGLESPALRAAIVASLTIVGRAMYRRPDPVTSLALTLGGVALLNPMVVHGVGFWLSATASMALCLALPKELKGNFRRRVLEVVLGPVAASLATMPIVLATFGTWSPVSILANIFIAPFITLAFWVAYPFAILALVAPGVAAYLAWIPGILLDFVLVIVAWLAPIAAEIRVDALPPAMMLLLWLPIGTAIWLASSESDRWIRYAMKRPNRSTVSSRSVISPP